MPAAQYRLVSLAFQADFLAREPVTRFADIGSGRAFVQGTIRSIISVITLSNFSRPDCCQLGCSSN
jgi:hypothetical protein